MLEYPSSMSPKTKYKIRKVLSWIAIGSFIILGTIFIVLYARGYRFDRDGGTVGKTGVLDVTAKPSRNDLYLNGENVGKTPKTIASIREGLHLVEVRRNGYFAWASTVEIVAEKSTPIYPILFRNDPEIRQSWAINGELIDKQATKFTNYIFFITAQTDEQLELATPVDPNLSENQPTSDELALDTEQVNGVETPESSEISGSPVAQTPPETEEAPTTTANPTEPVERTYKVWRYDTNPSFWNANQNPVEIYSEKLTDFPDSKPTFTLQISENGEQAVLTITQATDPNSPTIQNKRSLLLDTQGPNEQPTQLAINELLTDHTLTWAKDNEHLILASDNEILSFNTVNSVTTLLKRATAEIPNIPWTTDINGRFYYVEMMNDEEINRQYQQIHQMLLTGQSPTILVDRIYFSDKAELLISQDELISRDQLYTFSNSPQSTQFVGKITDLTIENDIDSIIMNTQYAMYMLDLQTDRYTLVSAVPSVYEKLSPNEQSLLITSENWLNIFNFDKEEADHTKELGLIRLVENKAFSGFRWHPSSRVIFYATDNKVKSIDITAENAYDLADAQDNFYLTDQGGENIYLLNADSENNVLRIVRNKLVD